MLSRLHPTVAPQRTGQRQPYPRPRSGCGPLLSSTFAWSSLLVAIRRGCSQREILSCGAGFHSVGIGSKSTGVSKHYWTVFDVPGVHVATSCLRPRLRFLLDSRRVAGMARTVIVQRSSAITVGRTVAEALFCTLGCRVG